MECDNSVEDEPEKEADAMEARESGSNRDNRLPNLTPGASGNFLTDSNKHYPYTSGPMPGDSNFVATGQQENSSLLTPGQQLQPAGSSTGTLHIEVTTSVLTRQSGSAF